MAKYAFDALRKCIYDAKTIRAMTAARICRNIYVRNFAAQREFMSKGYAEALMRLLKKSDGDPTGNLELLQGIMDLIMMNGSINPQSLHIFRNMGLIGQLQDIDAKYGVRNEIKVAITMLNGILTSI